MKTLEFDVVAATAMSEELTELDLSQYKPTCEIRWAHYKDVVEHFPDLARDYPYNIILVQKYTCIFPEKSLDPIWVPVKFIEQN